MPLRLGTQQAEARLIGIHRTRDAVSLENNSGPARGEAGTRSPRLRLRVQGLIAFDAGGKIPPLGRFVLMRAGVSPVRSYRFRGANDELPISDSPITGSASEAGAGYRAIVR